MTPLKADVTSHAPCLWIWALWMLEMWDRRGPAFDFAAKIVGIQSTIE